MKSCLTPKQQCFVEEYLKDLNGTQAAIRSGYSRKTANEQAGRLLVNVSVSAAIAEAIAARSERTQVSADSVLTELAKLGFANMLDYVTINEDGGAFVDLSKLTRDQAAAITEITVEEYKDARAEDGRAIIKTKIKLTDKRGPLELLGKHLGLFKDQLNISVRENEFDKMSTGELLAKAKELGIKGPV